MKRKLNAALVVLILYTMVIPFAASGCQAQKSWSRNDAIKGVVCVFTTNDPLDRITSGGRGSAFGVGAMGEETDIFVTNRHVVFDDKTNSIRNSIYILLDDDAVRVTYTPIGNIIEADETVELGAAARSYDPAFFSAARFLR